MKRNIPHLSRCLAGLLIALIGIPGMTTLSAQTPTLGDRAKTTANQKVGDKMDQTINGSVDSGFTKAGRAIGGLFKKKPKKTAALTDANGQSTTTSNPSMAGNPPADHNNGANGGQPNGAPVNSGQPNGSATPVVNGAFGDFTPGITPLFEDDFGQDALQDFPAKWNTNGSGKIVTIDGLPGKWLDIAHNSVVNPVLDRPLPDNCTISFDLFLQAQGDQLTPYIEFGLTPVTDVMKDDLFYKDKFFVGINRYRESDGHTLEYGLKDVVGNKNDFPLPNYANKVLHIDLAINKTRIRVYADRNKLIDLPRALTTDMHHNFYFASIMMVPAPQLGAALQQNPAVKILILGHTDSDGAAAHNMDLSQKRSAAVKNYLMTRYSIDATRIQSDGKGASIPVAPNNTEAGKAKNRRVEFVKL